MTHPAGATGAYHDLVGDLDYPMAIVTAGAGGERAGCLIGFHTQCSIDPARHLVCVSKKNATHRLAEGAGSLAVHILDEADHALAARFGELSGDEVDKFSGTAWDEGPEGLPILRDTAGWFAGHVLDRLSIDDHTGFVIEPFAGARRRPVRQLGFQAVRDMEPGHEA